MSEEQLQQLGPGDLALLQRMGLISQEYDDEDEDQEFADQMEAYGEEMMEEEMDEEADN